MKWGVRRNRASSSGSGKSSKMGKLKSKISKVKENRKKNSAKNLSDEELNKRIRRLELERKYNSLRREEINRGSQIAKQIIEGSVRTVGQELVRYGIGTGINTIAGRNIINLNTKKKKD